MKRNQMKTAAITLSLTAVVFVTSNRALAHCDTMDGPVVKAAQRALKERNADLVLHWVHKPAEAEIKEAFQRTLAVRELGERAKELADQYFFETVVRVHRAGEGAPYTGLKPAGTDLGPTIEAADMALESGSVEKLVKQVTEEAGAGIRKRFAEAHKKKAHAGHNVEAGRAFVAAYVEYVHYAEALHHSVKGATAQEARDHEAGPAEKDSLQQAASEHQH